MIEMYSSRRSGLPLRLAVRSGLLALLCGFATSGCGTSSVDEIPVDASAAREPVEPVSVGSTDWPWWRGPDRNGVAEGQSLPTEWSETENVVWKVPVPGRGHSSPIIVEERIFLATADDDRQVQSVLCLNRGDGAVLWQTDVHTGNFPDKDDVHQKNTNATCTLACDGQRVFGAFLNDGHVWVSALDLDGERLWQTNVGPFRPKFGYAPSPLVFENFVIVSGESKAGGFLAALHRKSGTIVWRNQRPSVATYSSPVVATVAGTPQLLISGANAVTSYVPATGVENWSCSGTAEATCGTLVWLDDLVFASGGYPEKETLCVRGDGSAEVLWRNRVSCYEQSMLAIDGHLYALNDDGIVFCWKADTGEEQWKARLGGPVSASPISANGLIYWANERGNVFVFRANPDAFELVAENQLEDEAFASPAAAGNQLFLRVANLDDGRQEYLYCIGRPAE